MNWAESFCIVGTVWGISVIILNTIDYRKSLKFEKRINSLEQRFQKLIYDLDSSGVMK